MILGSFPDPMHLPQLLVVARAVNINPDSGCSLAIDSDIALCSMLGLNNAMDLCGNSDHSNQRGPHDSMAL